eukprot:s992_g4.t1
MASILGSSQDDKKSPAEDPRSFLQGLALVTLSSGHVIFVTAVSSNVSSVVPLLPATGVWSQAREFWGP